MHMEKMLKNRQRPQTKLSSFHFHEVSDIISEEDSLTGLNIQNKR